MKYIGARYMPKFMGTYSATTIYEALSVVDDGLGTSYVSNKPVPAGTPLNDTNYWSVYGASSGAILDLQNRVGKIETNSHLRSFVDGDILCIGDSFADNVGFWPDKLRLLTNNTIFNKSLAGSGFVGNVATTFNDLIDSADSDSAIDNDNIRLIIIGGGSNDVGKSGVAAAAESALLNAITKFPKAIVMLVFMEMYPYDMLNVLTTITAYKQAAENKGAIFADISTNIKTRQGAVASDKMHPTNAGQTVIASCIYNLINGNKIPINAQLSITSTVLASVSDEWVKLFCYQLFMPTFDTVSAFTLDGNTALIEYELTNNNYYGLFERDCSEYNVKNVIGYIQYGGTYHLADIKLKITNGKLLVCPRCIESGSYVIIPATTHGTVEIECLSIEFPALYL